jgi:hypothetical protein
MRIFSIYLNASSRIMALGSTQPLTEMSTRNLPGGKGAAGAQGSQPYGPSRPGTGIALPFIYCMLS